MDFRSRLAKDCPRGSLPLCQPAGFSLPDAQACSNAVLEAYDQYAQWRREAYPNRTSFAWRPNLPQPWLTSVPFYWTYTWWNDVTYDEPFGFVAVNGSDDAFLALRGTCNEANEAQDAKILQTTYTPVDGFGCVHTGFFEIYEQLRPQILQAIKTLRDQRAIKRFFLTGHSLGSGLSTLALPDVAANSCLAGTDTSLCHINLASPRVGDYRFAAALNGCGIPTFRVVNTEDIVPDSPLAAPPGSLFYKHVGTPVDFTAQYFSVDANHAALGAYAYALSNPQQPEGPVPTRPLRDIHPGPSAALSAAATVVPAR